MAASGVGKTEQGCCGSNDAIVLSMACFLTIESLYLVPPTTNLGLLGNSGFGAFGGGASTGAFGSTAAPATNAFGGGGGMAQLIPLLQQNVTGGRETVILTIPLSLKTSLMGVKQSYFTVLGIRIPG
jgi:hypothetical protein